MTTAALAVLMALPSVCAPADLRDPALWPFASASPWNVPIGSEARFEPASASRWQDKASQFGFLLNVDEWTCPVYVASPQDPVRRIFRTDGTPPGRVAFEMRVPDAARPDPAGDAHLALVDERRTYVIEMLSARRKPDGDIEAPFPNRIDLRGPGISDTYIGACAYGGSTIAGLVRAGELTHGIRHALRMSVAPEVLNRRAPNGRWYVWPANTADGGDGASYSGDGNVYMGTLLAIPPTVDLTQVVRPGTADYELGRALQDYGAYVVDRGHFNLYAEPGAKAEMARITDRARRDLALRLQVVANNGPDRVGGGGKPRRPPAPPPVPEGQILLPGPAARPAQPAKPDPPPPPAPRPEPKPASPETVAAWDAKLQAAVRGDVAGGRFPRFQMSRIGQACSVDRLEESGTVVLRSAGSAFNLRWGDLSLKDRQELAAGRIREAQPAEDLSLAAFFALASGDARAAEAWLRRLPPADAEAIRDLFK